MSCFIWLLLVALAWKLLGAGVVMTLFLVSVVIGIITSD